tara:strand:- start:346 stop:1497 length:1152 start_codon:yes stop_codon:yes gene_type:complete
MKNVFILNHVRDTQLCLNFIDSFKKNIDIVITSFLKRSEYQVTGHKIFEPCMSEQDIKDFIDVLKYKNFTGKTFIVTNSNVFVELMKSYDQAISRGRAFLIFKPFIKKAIALSMNRTYMDRLIDVSPFWNNNLKIVLSSKHWVDEKICKSHLSIEDKHYKFIKGNPKNFMFFDFSHINKNILDNIGKDNIKKELNLPLDKKIAVISPRNEICDPFSLYKDNDDIFVSNTINQVKNLKNNGYYIVSRSRMDPKTKKVFKQKGRYSLSIELINRLNDLNIIDKVIDDNAGYPSKVWKVIYSADVVMVADNTSLCNVESVVLEKPVIMPYNSKLEKNIMNLNPPTREMYKSGILFKNLKDINLNKFNACISNFKKDWFEKYENHLG